VKRFYAVSFCLIILMAAPCWAQTFSVAILEDVQGLESKDLSNAVLGGCLDYLFTSGLIATNETIGRVERAVYQSSGYGLTTAREGFVDYIAFVWIRDENHPSISDITIPVDVELRLVRVRDGALLTEGTVVPPMYTDMTAEERNDIFTELGRSLADLWAKAL